MTSGGSPLIAAARGATALLFVLLWLALVALPSLLLLALPARFVAAGRRLSWVSGWARAHARIALAILAAGGARFHRAGTVRTDQPGIILMNHQSLLDIPTAILMCAPLVPAFIARARYAQVPMIGTGLRLADCPVVDPGRDREDALRSLARAVHGDRMLLLYPEGHRTMDGSLQPFRTAGLLAMLEARRVPVWLVVTDGFCSGRRLIDLVRLDGIRGRTAVVGRFEPPAEAGDLPAFLDAMQGELARALNDLRSRAPGSPLPRSD